ncbi:Lrp/AsnC family transcriptional regulator [Chloroflexota bacterium]
MLDRKIVTLLGEDAQQGNTVLAKKLNVSSATIRQRVKKLVYSGLLSIVSVADPVLLGLPLSVVLALDVAGEKSELVIKELTRRPEISWVSATTGPFDIIAIARVRSLVSLYSFLTNELALVDGIKDVQSFVCLNSEKGHRTFSF